MARVLYNTHNFAKKLSGVVVSLDKVQGGSYATALKATQDDEVYKDANARAYCVLHRYHIISISFEQLAVPPLTATPLVAAHDRAMGVHSARRAIPVRRYYLLTSNSLVTREALLVSRSDKLMIWGEI